VNRCHSQQSEDVIFAFQERLCGIVEVEIILRNGTRFSIFPTKLNEFLDCENAAVLALKGNESLDSFVSENEEKSRKFVVSKVHSKIAKSPIRKVSKTLPSDVNSTLRSVNMTIKDLHRLKAWAVDSFLFGQ
jgi:hypothetical protein